MPIDYTSQNGTASVSFDNPLDGVVLPPPYDVPTPSFYAMNEYPHRQKRVKPKGDAFDTWTTRQKRSSSITYSQVGQSRTRAISGDYDVVVTAPFSYFAGVAWVDDNWEPMSSFDMLDLAVRLKIKDMKINLAQAYGERRQTADLVFNLLRQVRGSIKGLTRSHGLSAVTRWIRDPRTASKDLANNWLQYQYGIKPLMSDIYGAAEALREKKARGLNVYVEVRKRSVRYNSDTVGLVTNKAETVLKQRVRVRFTFDDTPLPELVSLGITNPALLAWELLPWSFVADWSLNMGRFLSGFDALVGVSNVLVARSYTKESKNDPVVTVAPTPCRATAVARVTERLPLTGGLSFGSPTFDNPFASNGLVRAANAVALVRSGFR